MIGREYDRLAMDDGAIHYTTSADGTSIAWRRIGEGDADMLWLGGFVGHLEFILDQPLVQRFFDRVGAFASVVAFDKRGQGLSDRPDRAATMEEHAEDALAVMDAAGIERPTLVGISEGGPAAIVFAAAHPDRIAKLVLYGTYARLLRDDDYPEGATLAGLDRIRERALTDWGDPVALHGFAPSMADDRAFGAWWARLLRLGVSRSGVRQLLDTWEHIDVRAALPLVGVPTLVMCRSTDRMTPFAWNQYLADHIEGARIADLGPGDHLFFTGDTEPILRELHDFVTGTPGGPVPQEVLATVVFTDIVGSTQRAAELGDAEWHRVLERHDDLVRTELGRWRGREVKQLGDGFLASFEGPARAIRCAQAIAEGVRQFGLEIRAGIHTGECERRGDDLAGMAVHIGARVGAAADAGEILVSSTVRDLVVGSGIEFADRGAQELKGVPGEWRLYAVA
jgi:class 3 adenylate cyclase/alpha-beta hydrolase superfamily lysophospholipase